MAPAGVLHSNTPRISGTTRQGFVATVRGSVRLCDLGLLSLVPMGLLGLFSLPTSVKRELAFHYLRPTVESAFFSNYVHLSGAHLLANLVGFVLLAVTVYVLFALSARRRFFFTAITAILFGFPVILSVLNLAVPRNAMGLGFSGINAALLGLLPIAVGSYGRKYVSREIDTQTIVSAFLLSLAVLAFIFVPFSVHSISLMGLAFAGSALNYSFSARTILQDLLERPWYGEVLLGSSVLWVGFLVFGFGLSPAFDGATVNHYVHILGYCLSFMTAVVFQERQYLRSLLMR